MSEYASTIWDYAQGSCFPQRGNEKWCAIDHTNPVAPMQPGPAWMIAPVRVIPVGGNRGTFTGNFEFQNAPRGIAE